MFIINLYLFESQHLVGVTGGRKLLPVLLGIDPLRTIEPFIMQSIVILLYKSKKLKKMRWNIGMRLTVPLL